MSLGAEDVEEDFNPQDFDLDGNTLTDGDDGAFSNDDVADYVDDNGNSGYDPFRGTVFERDSGRSNETDSDGPAEKPSNDTEPDLEGRREIPDANRIS
jgi:hypothetical protein